MTSVVPGVLRPPPKLLLSVSPVTDVRSPAVGRRVSESSPRRRCVSTVRWGWHRTPPQLARLEVAFTAQAGLLALDEDKFAPQQLDPPVVHALGGCTYAGAAKAAFTSKAALR